MNSLKTQLNNMNYYRIFLNISYIYIQKNTCSNVKTLKLHVHKRENIIYIFKK